MMIHTMDSLIEAIGSQSLMPLATLSCRFGSMLL